MKRAVVGGIAVAGISTAVRLIGHQLGLSWPVASILDDLAAGITSGVIFFHAERIHSRRKSTEDNIRNALQIVKIMKEYDIEDIDYLTAIQGRLEKALHSHENVVRTDTSNVSKTLARGASGNSHVRDSSKSE